MAKLPELLAPAGTKESFQAALNGGADAIYLGSGRLNARGAKAQFEREDLPGLISEAHSRGTKVYLALNILLYEDELAEALDLLSFAREAGVDAAIVQDRGLMRLLNTLLPELVVHASTQCTAGTREALERYRELGCSRVVLPRELTLEQITDLTTFAHSIELETEVFIHGALCMSVSGQCHMSHFMGGRSANRGDCAQSCRKTYEILRGDDVFRPEGPWLSPRDLGAFSMLDRVLASGADSLKIEGRLRSAEYTGQITAVYREALNRLVAGDNAAEVLTPDRERDLLIAFNRGGSFNQQLWEGERNQEFLSGKRTGHMGLYLGQLAEIQEDQGSFYFFRAPELPQDYLPSSGSQMTLRTPKGEDLATAPCGVIRSGPLPRTIEVKGFHPKLLRRLKAPIEVWQMNQAEMVTLPDTADRRSPVDINLEQVTSGDFVLRLRQGASVLDVYASELDPAPEVLDSPLDPERVKQQLSKLGGTAYRPGVIKVEAAPAWRISDLNRFRRFALERLAEYEPVVEAKAVPSGASEAVAAKDWALAISLPFWQQSDPLPTVFRVTEGLFLLPAGEIAQLSETEFRTLKAGFHPRATLGVLMPPLEIVKVNQEIEEALIRLAPLGLAAVALGPSGLPKQLERLDLTKLLSIGWQGSQVWNQETYRALREEGYQSVLISPELSSDLSLSLARRIKDQQGEKPLLWYYGRTQAMFTRFCPVGFSKGKAHCRLCVGKSYSFRDDRERIFPLRPQRELDCSFEVWQSEAQTPGRDLDAALAEDLFIPAFTFTDESESEIEHLLRPFLISN